MTDRREMMGDIDHTHPTRGRPAGDLFARGPSVVADGGRRDAPAEENADDTPTMADVSHTPPHGDGANAVHRRGDESDE